MLFWTGEFCLQPRASLHDGHWLKGTEISLLMVHESVLFRSKFREAFWVFFFFFFLPVSAYHKLVSFFVFHKMEIDFNTFLPVIAGRCNGAVGADRACGPHG